MTRNNPTLSSQPANRLGDLLLQQQLITAQQLQQALQQQQHSRDKLGKVLLDMGLISSAALKRTLSKQRWLRPCAACFALISPFSSCFAGDHEEQLIQQWTNNSHWISAPSHAGDRTPSVQLVKLAAETAWDIYQGEPEAGEWRYSLSKLEQQQGYRIEMTMHF